MCHELARKFCVDELNAEWLKVEVTTNVACHLLNELICDELIAAWGKQQTERGVLCAEDADGKYKCHPYNAEEHLAEYLKMLSECHHLICIVKLLFTVVHRLILIVLAFERLQKMLQTARLSALHPVAPQAFPP